MTAINPIGFAAAPDATTYEQDKSNSAAVQFRKQLQQARQTSGGNGGDDNEETSSVIQRSVISGGDGSQILVLTQVTLDANGRKIASTVISQTKISDNAATDTNTAAERTGNAPITEPDKNTAVPLAHAAAEKTYNQNQPAATDDLTQLFKLSI